MATPYYTKFETDAKVEAQINDSIALSDPTIAIVPTGNVHILGVGPGTYAFWGGLTVPDNNTATLRRVGGSFSMSLTPVDLSFKVNVSDVIDSLTSTETAKPLSANQGKLLDEKKIELYYQPGENIFNKNATDVVLGRYINALGTTGANAQYNITGYIPIEEGTVYTSSHIHSREFYDANKVAIQFIQSNVVNLTVTAPTNAKFFRHTVNIANWATFKIQVGTFCASYTPYTETKQIDKTVFVPQNQVLGLEDKIFTKSTGKNKFNINGDVSLGKYVGPSGALSSNASYNVTPYMGVVAGQTYTMSARHNIAWYDETFTLVLFEGVIDINDITVIAPANAVYLRCTVPIESWVLFQLENNTFQTAFEAYKEVYVLDNFGVYSSQILNKVDTTTQTKEVNLSMTKNQYLLGGSENNIYFPALLDKSKPNYSVRFPAPFFNFKNFARLTNPSSESTGLTVNVYNDDFAVIESKVIDLKIGNPATNNGTLNIIAIGDSFTHGGQYLKKVYDVCPALNLHGMRSTDSPVSYPFKYEGRGGWTLQRYLDPKVDGDGFSPFSHPTNASYKYYGTTSFWYNVYNTPNAYGFQYFEAKRAEIGFSTTTGIKSTPQVNDLMYFDQDGSNTYKYYNGSSWMVVALTNSDFTFNFPKYRTVWNITQPNIVTVLLGLNDFRMKNDVTEVNTLFTTWSSQMDSLIASIKADNASVKIAILIPSSYCGSDDNTEGAFNSKLNRMMWESRKLIIAEYDQRDAESIYLVDTGSVIDPDFGFYTNMDTEFNATWVEDTRVPFIGYTDTKKRELDYNTPHPSPDGYTQIGIKVAGFIQKIR